MAFDIYPSQDTVLELAPGGQSEPQPITPRFGSGDGPMFMRIVQLTRGQPAPPPTIALQAGTGPMTVVAQDESVTDLTGSADPAVVANVDFRAEPGDVYRIRLFPVDNVPAPAQFALQITNGDTAARTFRWVVADTLDDSAQSRVTLPPTTHLDTHPGPATPGAIPVPNGGTGALRITTSVGSDLGSGFTLTSVPDPIPPNGAAQLQVTYTPPSPLPAGATAYASTTYTFATNDPVAQRPDRNDARTTITATTSAPLWQPGDILVVDPGAGDGSAGRGALLRIDPATGRQTLVSAGHNFASPAGVALDTEGNALVADPSAVDGNGALIRVDRITGAQTVLSSGNSFRDPTSLVVTPLGRIVVADRTAFGGIGGLIVVDAQTGTQVKLASGDPLRKPTIVAVDDPHAESFVALNSEMTANAEWLIRVDPRGQNLQAAAGSLATGDVGIAVDAARRILLGQQRSDSPPEVIALAPDGSQAVLHGGPPLVHPIRLRLDNGGGVVITDWPPDNSAPPKVIRIRLSDGQVTTVSTAGMLRQPFDIAVVP
jgi:hypothetical protein